MLLIYFAVKFKIFGRGVFSIKPFLINYLANVTNAGNFRVLEDIGNEKTELIIHAGHFIVSQF